jgi:DNA-binding XRE family transcriptional regulator
MKKKRIKELERRGWKIGDAQDFLKLDDSEIAFIELNIALRKRIRKLRKEQGVSQVLLAKMMGSSQSRISKMEAGDPSISIDFMIRTLLTLGATRDEIAEAIGQ